MVVVVMTTYDDGNGLRFEYAKQCYAAWCAYSHNPWIASQHILVADDGSPNAHLLDEWNMRAVTGPHNGIGASLNRALRTIVTEPWVYTTDDWLLTGPIDLELPLWLLSAGYDMVRLGPMHPNLHCTTRFTQGHGWWLDIDIASGGFAFGTRPFLAAPSLVNKIGLFDEGLDAYATEQRYAQRCAAFHADHPNALAFASVEIHGPWEHIGDYEVGDRPVV